MKTNLKDNIWIEGFDSEIDATISGQNTWFGENMELFIWAGKTSEISEEIARECVIFGYPFDGLYTTLYQNYKTNSHPFEDVGHLNSAKESIQSACNQEYCIIYKQ